MSFTCHGCYIPLFTQCRYIYQHFHCLLRHVFLIFFFNANFTKHGSKISIASEAFFCLLLYPTAAAAAFYYIFFLLTLDRSLCQDLPSPTELVLNERRSCLVLPLHSSASSSFFSSLQLSFLFPPVTNRTK